MKSRLLCNSLLATMVLASAAAGSQSEPALKQTTIHGLAVMLGPDGQAHGKALEIIATPGLGGHGVRFSRTVGKDMQTALNEAIRVVKLRHSDVDNESIELSFDDKYSSKDGGSAGAAFTLALLSSYGDLAINPDAAITGDITIDSKVRSVGEVEAKVHGAALDHMALVGIPASDMEQIEDGILLDGPASLWQIPIFSLENLDDAIALMRRDPDTRLTQALKLFADLKAADGDKPAESLNTGDAAAKLSQMLALAPNFVSARYLQQLAAGKKPQRLSTLGSIRQAFAAMGQLRGPLLGTARGGVAVSDEDADKIRKNLDRIKEIADPAAEPLFGPLHDVLDTYVKLQNIPHGGATIRERSSLRQELRARHAAVIEALQSVISDPATVDKLLH